MASTSSSTSIIALLQNNKNTHNHKNLYHDNQFSFLRRSNFHGFHSTSQSNKDLVVRRVMPEVAGDILSSNPLSGIPFIGDNPLLAGLCAIFVGVPLMIQKILMVAKQVEVASQGVEKIMDKVEDYADKADKVAEKLKEALPEGRLKEAVAFVEKVAENASDGADKISDLMDMVQEMEDKLEEFIDTDKNKST